MLSTTPNNRDKFALKLTGIFIDKSWSINEVTFQKTLDFLCVLQNSTAEMFLDLLVDFIWLTGPIQSQSLHEIGKDIANNGLLRDKIVYVLPFYKERKDEPGTFAFSRSGNGVVYMLQNLQYQDNLFGAEKIVFCDTYKSIPHKLGDKKAVVYVDDFIGTGGTVKDALDFLYQNCPAFAEEVKPIVLTLACTSYGREFMAENLPGGFFFRHLIPKGITDNMRFSDRQKSEFISLMEAFEYDIQVQDQYCFGYGRSECLLTMSKTPNNTFPAFWVPPKGRYKYKPIFERC